ncbi:MAG: ketoacyl-ACP synthase III [Schwartzia succinivorans]|nr:ketoacyl-ACP synthase III [Schwartzia succinivorans]
MKSFSDLFGDNNVDKIMKVTGIKSVRRAPKGMTVSDYCVYAAEKLISELHIDSADIDGLVFITESPDYLVPHTSAILQDRLGLPKSSIVFDINYGCSGYVYGLFQAFMMIESGYCKNVLLCAGDTLSRKVNPKDKASQMVLGDAGTATIITAIDEARPVAFSFFTDGSGAKHLIIPAGGARIPHQAGKTDILNVDADGNARTDEDFYMNGMEVMEFTLHDVKSVIQDAMDLVNWDKAEVDLFALHQANALIVKYIRKQLKADKEKVPFALENYGNSSSGTIPVLLCNKYSGVNRDFKKVLIAGFGTGLSCAAGTIGLESTVILPTYEL